MRSNAFQPRLAAILRVGLAMVFLLSAKAGAKAETVHFSRLVNIPFSQPIDPESIRWALTQGWPTPPPDRYGQGQPRPAQMEIKAPVSGTLIVRLSVARAQWDAVGLYAAVPIGMCVFVYSPPYGPQGDHVHWRDQSGWVAALGRVDILVRNVRKGDTIHVRFSTLAPAGAQGVLSVVTP